LCASHLNHVIGKNRRSIQNKTAHSITGALAYKTEEENIPGYQVTSEMLDEAAVEIIWRPPQMDEKGVRQAFDPVHFVQVHNSVGGVAPSEVRRMIKDRMKRLEGAEKGQAERVSKLERAHEQLNAEVSSIIEST